MSHRKFSEQFLAAMHSGDRAAMGQMLHAQFEVEEAASLPYGGVYRGTEGWLALCSAVVGTWAKFSLQLLEYAGESADSLVIRFAISGRSRKTGKSFESTVLELWRFKDGKLFRIYPYYFDTALLAAADTQ
ncbi:MAG TPA: nuclear transport factor 2 family protein [Steroidobacteraceae bacterium]|nr:nuclear transport factor 2 family protein [Steroidobacteraceae bacterium]